MAQPSLRTREAVAVPADTTDENRPFFAMFQNAYIIADNNISAKVFPAFNDSDHRKGTPTIQRQAPHPPRYPDCEGLLPARAARPATCCARLEVFAERWGAGPAEGDSGGGKRCDEECAHLPNNKGRGGETLRFK